MVKRETASYDDLILSLMGARRSSEGVGNRRRLFGLFDQIFAGGIGADIEPSIAATKLLGPASGDFRLRKALLTNWKAFSSASIEFGRHAPDRPLILIGGNNGNGKTSILQAILVCIYGHKADLVAGGAGGGEAIASSRRSDYRLFIERAMHRPSFEAGNRMLAVTLEFDTREGVLEIERRWYLDDDGRYQDDDEELVLRIGDDRDIVAVPPDRELTEYYEDTIARLIAPASMMSFFLFDGEHVRRLAQRELSEQVQFGIESALGIAALKDLIGDLRDYAKDRARDIQADDAEAAAALKLKVIEAERAAALAEQARIQSTLEPLQLRRDEIVHGLGVLGRGTYGDTREELELRHDEEAQLRKLRDDLRLTLAKHFPIALVGNTLLTATERALQQGVGEAFAAPDGLDVLIRHLQMLEPRLDEATQRIVVERVQNAWTALSERKVAPGHAYLEGHRIAPIMHTMADMRREGLEATRATVAMIVRLKESIERRNKTLSARASADQERQYLASELSDINSSIASLEAARRNIDLALGSIEGRIGPIRAEWEKRRAQRKVSSPMLTSVEAANKAMELIQGMIERVVPEYYGILAAKITSIYTQLAHKGVVERIAIGVSGTVSLMDRQGRDLREYDASAGENQIFAMSLMAAVSELLEGPLPFIIDTPLGRLDPQHRERILKYLSERPAQTILLSQPEEVGGAYYQLIAHKVSDEFHLQYIPGLSGLGGTQIAPGYFARKAA